MPAVARCAAEAHRRGPAWRARTRGRRFTAMSTRDETDHVALDGTRMSEEEFLALPETTARIELVDGLVVCEPSADFGHQRCVRDLVVALEAAARALLPRPTVCLSALDVRFAPGRILQPDVFVYVEPLREPVAMPITRIPDLCIEVVSTRHAYDRITKRQIYAEAGVKELWTVVRKSKFVERWTGPGLATRDEWREKLVTPLLPGFALDVARLFEA